VTNWVTTGSTIRRFRDRSVTNAPASPPPTPGAAELLPSSLATTRPDPSVGFPRSCTSIPSASGRVSRRMNDRAIVRIAVGGELP
jgi:hypothetical protein